MDSEKWQKVKSVFDQVVFLSPAERSKQLIVLTETDRELRAEVESLLEFDSQKQVICSNAIPLEGITSGATVGPYRLNFPLAINERTEVWQAIHQTLPEDSADRKVAIKFFKDLHGDERRARRFQQEAAILSRFKHPSIARLLEEGKTDSGVPWFSTAYVEGLDLLAMADRQKFGLEQRLDLFDQVCAALEYSHRFLVIHRDVKPGNVVVDESGKAVLIDFGISKQLEPSPIDADQLTRTFERTLTPAYASPEQLRGEPVSGVTDVYGAGLMLYELISRQHPYSDAVHQDGKPLFDRILFEMPLPPSQAARVKADSELPRIASDVSNPSFERGVIQSNAPSALQLNEGLDRIVLKAIAKTPDQRYQSIAELRRHLAAWRTGKPIDDGSIPKQSPSWIQRNAILCSIGACLFGIALTLGMTGLLSKGNSDLSKQLELLQNISNSSVDFVSLEKSDWKELSPVSKLSLANLAIEDQKFDQATQIALEVDTSQLAQAEKFKIAKLWNELGFPDKAYVSAGVDANTFNELAEDEPSLESYRRLICRLHLEMGQPTLARKINNAGLRSTVADRFERELIENEIREASKWFDGLDSRIELAKKQLSNPRLREQDRRAFADLLLRRQGTEEELKQALLDLDDRPGEWSRSKAKLTLAKMLLDNGKETEGKTLLLEVVSKFQDLNLPLHPIAMDAWILADLFLVQELEIAKWWNQYESQIPLNHARSLKLFAGVVKWERDPLRHYQTLRPWLEKTDPIENGPAKVAVFREVWRGAIESNDTEGAALMVDSLLKSSEQFVDKDSLEYAEVLVIASILQRYVGQQNAETEAERLKTIRRICNDAIKKHDDNVTVSFLKAIDLNSPDSVFKLPQTAGEKSPSGWIREFVYHRANRASDQLEMVAWFSEYHADTNPDDVLRLVNEAMKYRDAKDWGGRGDTNWKRVVTIGAKLTKKTQSE